MSVESRPLHRDGLESIKRSDGQALYDPETGIVYEMDATSMAIWEACDGRTTVGELTAAIAELGGIGDEDSASIVASALAELETAGLIVS